MKKIAVKLAVVFIFLCCNLPLAAAVAETKLSSRVVQSFDEDWRFAQTDGENQKQPDFADQSWRKLNVPHDWSIEGKIDEKNLSGKGGGFFPTGIGWYRKHFVGSSEMKNRRVFIEFDGVMANSEVWINGVSLGKRPSGYISFVYELTDHLNFGKDNVIAVRADNLQQPASRWYTGAGIYRHVKLKIVDPVHLEQWGTFVSTPQAAADQAVVKVQTAIINQSNQPQSVNLQISVVAPNGKTVGTMETQPQQIAAGQTANFEQSVNVKNPELWNVERGIMYTAIARVRAKGKTLDDEIVPFGIREFHFDADTGFWINGKNLKILGACLHHDGSAFGAAVPLAVWERRLTNLRKVGVNAIRTAHNPPAPEFLDLLDKMGFLVMDEMFDQWTVAKNPYDYHLNFNEWSKIDLRDTVRRDRNHPSVIIYSAGNEIHDTPNAELAKRILRGLVDAFHENDNTRPVTQALFRPNVSKDYDNGLADILDVVGQNYREKEILAAHKQKPTRKILGTENAHDLNQWVAMRDNPEYSGQFIWAGIDYLGESPAFPNIAFGKGLLDRTGTPRSLGFQRQSWWSKEPMVYIVRKVAPTQATATDPGYEPVQQRRGQNLFNDWSPSNSAAHRENVEIYSNCEEVELFLNGKSLGKKTKPANDSPRNWDVAFEPGTIRAVGSNGGKIAANYELRTAGKPAKIVLTVDKTNLANDWNDVAFAAATVIDANGVVVPIADNEISFKLDGAGIIAAVDSADNTSHEAFQAANSRKAFEGVCFAMLKANKNSGKITLTASAPNLQSAIVTINATAAK